MLSEKLGITSPSYHHILTSPLGSPAAAAKFLGGGGVSSKKQYSKNKETILLPHLKDAGELLCSSRGILYCTVSGSIVPF